MLIPFTARMSLSEHVLRDRQDDKHTLLTLMDLSVTVNTIEHGNLLDHPLGLGLGSILPWFQPCLKGRFSECSAWGTNCLASGVLQGSTLSPMFFSIYIKKTSGDLG